MDTTRRSCLIALLAILFAFTGYGQNQRVQSLQASAGITTAVLRATSTATFAGGSLDSGGATNSNHQRNTGWGENSGHWTNTAAGTVKFQGGTLFSAGSTNTAHQRNTGWVENSGNETNTSAGKIEFQGGTRFAAGSTNTAHQRNTGWVENSGNVTNTAAGKVEFQGGVQTVAGTTNIGPTATHQAAPLRLVGGLVLQPITNLATLAISVVTNVNYCWTTNGNVTVAFTGTAPDGARGEFRVWNTSDANNTLTWPASYSEAQGAGITSIILVSNSVTRVIWRIESGSNYVNVIQKDAYQLGLLNPSVGQVLKVHCTSCGPGGSLVFTNAADADTGGTTAYNALGDSAADGEVAMAGFRQSYTSTLNGGVMRTQTNSVADITSDTFMTELAFRDNADANAFFTKWTHNAGAATAFSYSSALGFFGVPLTNSQTFLNAGAVGFGSTLSVAGASTFTGTTTTSSSNSTTMLVAGAAGFGSSLTLAGNLLFQSGNDPDVSAEGGAAWDANGDYLRVHDGVNQVAVARKIEAIHVTVVLPNDLDDSERDAFWIWENVSGMNFIVTGWSAKSDTDDTTLNIEEIDNDGLNNTTVDAVEIATNGTGLFYASDSTITAATIENGHLLVLDFDDTDAPGQVKITIFGYYDANVN